MKKPDQKQKQRAALVLCLDGLNDSWHTLHALTGLLALCQETSVPAIDPEVIGGAAYLMRKELDRMHEGLQQLDREMAR